MRAPDFRFELRGAAYRGDGPAVVTLVRDQFLREDALQLIGDGLPVALALNIKVAIRPANACRLAFRERGTGDDELADQFDALLGTGTIPLLRPLPVDLEELAGVLEGRLIEHADDFACATDLWALSGALGGPGRRTNARYSSADVDK